MRPYLISIAAGVLVGVIYGLLKVRSPAPPAIALVGLLGILVGEQVVPLAKSLFASRQEAATIRTSCSEHVLGRLPSNNEAAERAA
ncbi:XapX domain-containing protein [Sphingomonas sp. SORGH_AS_0879]|uniref:XapX domain-containing protein n=1 Tax=Sphingomonas sp. SORGH_AS_0879 TaxID=3041790 RepID=UPI00278380F5|nr:XapX domain-containing protein [Sphingomonas sp. SORGH_AS_0879]MDQ1229164.1 XapX domain-containing protein [Sphingomonas sp. SORGH_AS_0879]